MTAPPIAPRLEAGVCELGDVAEWMHDKQHIRSDLRKRKGKGAPAIMTDLKPRSARFLSDIFNAPDHLIAEMA